jgi:DNA repair protein RadD
MSVTLREYQERALAGTVRVLHKRPILVAPTGSGKTVMASALVRRLNARTLWIAHRRELIHQAAATLRKLGMRTHLILAGEDSDRTGNMFAAPATEAAEPTPDPASPPIYVASIQTLARRTIPEVDLVIIDEAHHASADSYQPVLCLENALGPVPVIGLTATPFRLDGKPLGDMFKSIVVAAHCDELVASGILHAPRVYCANGPDLAGVKITMGEYNLGDVGRAVNKPSLIGDILKEWSLRAGPKDGIETDTDKGRRTVCFATNVEHSKAIVEAFKEFDIRAEHLDGSTSKDERDGILSRLRSGETTIVSNCMVLTEGWDLPALECAIIARPTASLNLHLQMIGRIMRAAEGKNNCTVLDHAGNHHRHGLVTRRLEYSLEGSVKPLTAGEPLGLKRCAACGLMVPTDAEVCPDCAAAFQPQKREIKHKPGDLTEFDDSSFEYRQHAWGQFRAAADAMGHAEGSAVYRFKERFGEFPVLTEAGELVNVRNATVEQKKGVYERFVRIAEEKGFKPGWASHQYREIFGVWPSGFVRDVKAAKLTERWRQREAV